MIGGILWVDILLILIILFSSVLGLIRGFVKESLSILVWVAAFWVALTFSDTMTAILPASLEGADFTIFGMSFHIGNMRVGVAFLILFLSVLIIGSIVSYTISYLTRTRALRGIDRALGFAFGVVRGAAIIVILVLVAGLTNMPQTEWWYEADLIWPFQRGAEWVLQLLPAKYAQYFSFGTQ